MTKQPRLKTLGPRLKPIDTRTVRPPPKVVESIYSSSEWKTLMREIFEERGRRCEDTECKTPHGPWGKLYGDHVIEIKDQGPAFDKRNVLIRCAPCHGRKTAAERVKRGAKQW